MIDIRIVCTHDAVKTAQTLRRLLEAELHTVDVSFGRHSLDHFESALNGHEIALLIWSKDAPGAHYMHEWASRFDPARLIEIAAAPGWPALSRKAPVIEFTAWKGERGGAAWRALNERLARLIRRTENPPPPPPRRAAAALLAVSAAAVAGALAIRVNVPQTVVPEPLRQDAAAAMHVTPIAPDIAMGGPLEATALDAVEPLSVEDVEHIPRPHVRRIALFHPVDITPLATMSEIPDIEIHQPTLFERIGELNPFNRDSSRT